MLFRFSLPVRPSELVRRLTVACDGETVRAEAASEWPGNELLVRFPRKAGARECRITIDGFLTSDGGDRPMGSPVEKRLDFGKGLALEGTGFNGFRRAPPDPDRCTVELWFNRPLDRRLAPPAVTVSPEVKDLAVRFSDWDCELLLEGEFAPGTLYVIRVPAGLKSRDGVVLETEAVSEYAVPDRPPSVRIPFARGVLSPKGNRLLEVYAANAPVLAVTATRIHENNLCAHLLGLRADLTGREVLRREYPVPGTANRLQAAALDLGALLGDARGLYRVEVDVPGAWAEDSAVVALTDLAITVKRGRLGLTAWVTGLSTGAPVEGARVAALSRTNQPLAEGTTGPDGLARLEVPANHPDGDAWLVTAEKDGDRAFLALDGEPRLCDGTDQSGRLVPETWDVMLYADRGAYRPGETIHLTGIVRRPDGSPAPEFPRGRGRAARRRGGGDPHGDARRAGLL